METHPSTPLLAMDMLESSGSSSVPSVKSLNKTRQVSSI